mgnify:CR=1 FL=1
MIRNRTTVVAETLKRKVVKDRTVILRQRFASLALEVLADRDSVTLLEKAFDRRIAVRKEIAVIEQTGKKRNQPFDIRFAVLVLRLPM